ncbi:MAG TPA: hypothetical protein VKU01_00775 [Bryobacteraceae bacterium]|nr:hypothetical protein [Bryobacteraceae bacterium]
MRVVLRSSSLLFTTLGIVLNAPVARVREALRLGVAGHVQIGMRVQDVLVMFEGRTRYNPDNSSLQVYATSPPQGRPDLAIALKNGLVSSIRVYSGRYRMDTGIGIGSPLMEVASHHSLHWLDDNTSEADGLKMQFVFKKETVVSILVM